eukprot:8731-Eustigmatos_ZCMA.PRE.1
MALYHVDGPSPAFAEVRELMRSDACGARMHWGKGGVYSCKCPTCVVADNEADTSPRTSVNELT